ncbi:hypothetical protein JTE90_018907 [Oedothorax gibbosus]|uniref:Chitin-binding type-2 domain-containing protein n=1 Tax=Oedothorax gibbosus TaxID=931172 RepID=A0AAV6VWC4_9ARAC|nr:hypothetical protein JTE90_018907 [Oedothorax gibbosus]
MLKCRAMPFLISFVVFTTAIHCSMGELRTKRQAPNINVHNIPKTSFSCGDRTIGEYYADPEVFCQVYHVCVPGMHNKMSLISFVCPNGTIFSQATRVCTPFDRVDCSLAKKFYDSVNGQHDSAIRRNFEEDYEDNYVPPPARKPSQAPATTPRQEQPSRNSRFRSNQFRQPQTTTTTTTQAPTTPARLPSRAAFRPPPPPARPVLPTNLRPTARAVVSTSTSSYNYEYEYDYEYEDDNAAEQPNARSKRSAGFSCEGKVPGGAYADVETDCEMFHICVLLGKDKILDYKVSCGNGTAFDQEIGYCREKEEFDCQNAQLYYQHDKQKQPQFTKKLVPGKKKVMKPKKIVKE